MHTSYEVKVNSFDLGKHGQLNYAQWLHPLEAKKTFSEKQIDLVKKYIKEGSVVLDIGAHTGDTTLPYAVAAGKNGAVIAFEPNPAVFAVLSKNSLLNRNCRIIAVNYAATENRGTFIFHYSDKDLCNGGYAEILAAGIGVSGHVWPVVVRGVNLDTWLRGHYPDLIERISFIKIDTEGYDKNVLKTLSNIVRATKPIIQVELFSGLSVEERKEFFTLIKELNYSAYDFSGVDKDIDRIGRPLTENEFCNMNVISGHDLILIEVENE